MNMLRHSWLGWPLMLLALGVVAADPPPKAPFPYVRAHAWHILPETHSDESGYFALCEGADGRIYVGTAKYGENAYLVEFDPATQQQRIIIDVNKVCGLTARGYAAQAKIHTRCFTGPSGRIYVGSKQGYRRGPEDTAEYPGGYVLVYDPKTGVATNLGMPRAKLGVIDVVADETRKLLYVVTCEDNYWMLGQLGTGQYRDLGPRLCAYAATLLDRDGRANAITREFQLAQYDPATDKTTVRPIIVAGQPLKDPGIPIWETSPDRAHAWLIRMTDPTLYEIDLLSPGAEVQAVSHGRMIEGKGFDCRSGLDVAPDGRVYACIRVDNETGFGTGYLHHLLRFDPQPKKSTDLGVLAVENPDFFDFTAKRPWTHGYHHLPDGTMTPLHCHMALLAAHNGDVYITVIYPFTLLRIPAPK